MGHITPPGGGGGGGGGGAAIQAAAVVTSEASSSTTYTDLATAGPSITVTVGASGTVVLWISSRAKTAGAGVGMLITVVGSGTNTVAASDLNAGSHELGNSDDFYTLNRCIVLTGLSTGATTFKMQYRNSGATSGTWYNRNIAGVAL